MTVESRESGPKGCPVCVLWTLTLTDIYEVPGRTDDWVPPEMSARPPDGVLQNVGQPVLGDRVELRKA